MTCKKLFVRQCEMCSPEWNSKWAVQQIHGEALEGWLYCDSVHLCADHHATIRQVVVNLDAFLNELNVTYPWLRKALDAAGGAS